MVGIWAGPGGALAALRGRDHAPPTPSRSAALIDSWRTTADGAGSKTALGAALHARSLRSSLTRGSTLGAFSWGKNSKHAYSRGCLCPPARAQHIHQPSTFCPPELRVAHAVVVTVREVGRPPSRGQLSRASPLLSLLCVIGSFVQ